MAIRAYIRKIVIRVTDALYLPVFQFVPKETFRYGVLGGANMVLDMVLYFLVFHFVLDKRIVELGFVAISPYIASFLVVFPITFLSGFWLQSTITFSGSTLARKTQLVRYLITVAISILINYLGLKLLVEVLDIYPTPSKGIVTVISVAVSYFSQKYFTFTGRNQLK